MVGTPYSAVPPLRARAEGVTLQSTTLGDIHACLQEISSRLELLVPRANTQHAATDGQAVPGSTQPMTASIARASASSLVLRSQHLAGQHALARQARQAESISALREAVGALLAPHLASPADVARCAGEDVLDAVVGAVLRQQVGDK